MEIYLTLPGGERKGPYSLQEINRDLALKKYKDTDFWAWYSGQDDWVPLHTVPGVVGSDDTAVWFLDQAGKAAPAAAPQAAPAKTEAAAPAAAPQKAQKPAPAPQPEPPADPSPATPAAPPPEPDRTPSALERKLFSGLPFAALEQVFVLTTGDGPAAARSEVTTRMLEHTAGQPLAAIREKAPRDVLSHCAFIEQLRMQAALPAAAWSAMANYKTQVVQDARAGLHKVCVRTFPIESGDLVCVFLFYNKQKL